MWFLKFFGRDSFRGQAARYFFAALIGLIVDYGTLVFSKEILNFHYLLAAASGFMFGLVVVYLLSNKYVFGQQKLESKTHNFIIFGLIGAVGLGILSVLMWLFTGLAGLNYVLSKTLATIFVFIWNFLARRNLYHNQF